MTETSDRFSRYDTADYLTDPADAAAYLEAALEDSSDPTDVAIHLDIPTLEGVMTARAGDWIIRGAQGEFYPCKPDIFEATYEEAT